MIFQNALKNASKVLLLPVYSAGEKKDKSYNQKKFSHLIFKNSRVSTINVYSENDLEKYFKNRYMNNNIIIGLGAGSISQMIRNLKKKL